MHYGMILINVNRLHHGTSILAVCGIVSVYAEFILHQQLAIPAARRRSNRMITVKFVPGRKFVQDRLWNLWSRKNQALCVLLIEITLYGATAL